MTLTRYKTHHNSTRKLAFIFYAVVQLLDLSSVTIVPFVSNANAFASNIQLLSKSRCCRDRIVDNIAHRMVYDRTNGASDGAGTGVGGSVDLGRILSENSIYFDIEVANQPIGRLVFHLTNPSSLPKYAENILQLAKGSRRGIDPKAHYIGCEFDFSPATVEDGNGNNGRYRWSHQLKGRGRNGIGKADEPIKDPESLARCCHSTFGGQYYGDLYTYTYTSAIDNEHETDPGVLLTVPVVGPGYGTSKFSMVRVAESPKEWRETLLINSGVIGRLDPSSLPVVHAMARQRMGPPTVVASGGGV